MNDVERSIAQGLAEALRHAKGEDVGATVHRVDTSKVDAGAARKKLGIPREAG